MGKGGVNTVKTFRARLLAGEALIGTWIKTPSHIITDVIGLTPLDCVCLDAEHAPFDRIALDACISALKAANMPGLVRVPTGAPEHILNALDCGATGIVAPHISSAAEAYAFAKACRYGAGGRGFAGSSRAAGYTTTGMPEHIESSNHEAAVIAQIEDISAVDAIDDIAAVEGVDCLFIGRNDLTVAMGKDDSSDPQVIAAVRKICNAGASAGRAVGMFLSNFSEIPNWRDDGATLFILKSEHAFILDGAREMRAKFDHLAGRSTR